MKKRCCLIKAIFLKMILFVVFLSISNLTYGQENNIDKSVSEKFASIDFSKVQTLQEIVKNINLLTNDKKEQLEMLLLWSYQNMNVDSNRFFNGGMPLTRTESIKNRLGLCDEFSSIVNDFCKSVNIPAIKVAGYVKYINFHPGDTYKEANHAWNAVFVDSTWMLCDLFWSITELKESNSSLPHFAKRFNTKYYLGHPSFFIKDHLPCDPVFQFDNYPIKIEAFTSVVEGIDTAMEKMPYFNYKDSVNNLMKLNDKNRQLRISEHTYSYNRYNPNDLIAEYYNYSVDVLNNKTSAKQELRNVKTYLTAAISLIDISKKDDIKALKENCKLGLTRVNKKLAMQGR